MTEYRMQRIETRIVRDSKEPKQTVICSDEAYELVKCLQDEAVEKFAAIYLNTRRKVIASVVLFSGGMMEAVVDVRLVIKTALDVGAQAFIVVHNHPSGDPTPSLEDKKITEKIRSAADLFDIKVLDHLVIGLNEYYSFADEGII